MGRTQRGLRRGAPALGLLALACAPPEADVAISERARGAPPPALIATARFDAPLAAGAAGAERLAGETDALAARAEALRARGVALSGAEVIDPAARGRLEGAPQAGPD
jgi:hypothetical protein